MQGKRIPDSQRVQVRLHAADAEYLRKRYPGEVNEFLRELVAGVVRRLREDDGPPSRP